LVAEVERQYRGKNTMGYGLNSLLDFEAPVDMLANLMVGSEGSLGFVAEVECEPLPTAPGVPPALVVFGALEAATRILPVLVATGAATLELMDAASLRVVQADPAAHGIVDRLDRVAHARLGVAQPDPAAHGIVDGLDIVAHAALLIEYQAYDDASLDGLLATARDA